MEEFKVEGYKHTFRIAKMNAIELLAMQTQIDFSDYKSAVNSFSIALEHCEVRMPGTESWMKVKDGEAYFPAEIENDTVLAEGVAKKFLLYIKSVFRNRANRKSKHNSRFA